MVLTQLENIIFQTNYTNISETDIFIVVG